MTDKLKVKNLVVDQKYTPIDKTVQGFGSLDGVS